MIVYLVVVYLVFVYIYSGCLFEMAASAADNYTTKTLNIITPPKH